MAFGGGRRFVRRKNWHVEVSPDPQLRSDTDKDVANLEGVVSSANLTADASGLAHYDEKMFFRTLRTGKVNGVRPLSTAMPWLYFRKMHDEDLAAIFAYLRSLPHVQHRVNNTEKPTFCPVCKRRHGLGEWNEAPGSTPSAAQR